MTQAMMTESTTAESTDLGDQIRTYRLLHNMTQRELGRRMNSSASTVIQMENNKQKISVPQLLKLCEIFSIDPNTFLGIGTTYYESTLQAGFNKGWHSAITAMAETLGTLDPPGGSGG